MAALTSTSDSKTYTGVSLIAFRYFRALCTLAHLTHNESDYTYVEENSRGGATFTVTVNSRGAYNLMQEVFEAQNG